MLVLDLLSDCLVLFTFLHTKSCFSLSVYPKYSKPLSNVAFCPPKSFRFIFSYIKITLKLVFLSLGLYCSRLFLFLIFNERDLCFWHISKTCYHIQSVGFIYFYFPKHTSFHHPWDSLALYPLVVLFGCLDLFTLK